MMPLKHDGSDTHAIISAGMLIRRDELNVRSIGLCDRIRVRIADLEIDSECGLRIDTGNGPSVPVLCSSVMF